jgi:predicted dehydrogenase
MWRDPLPGSTRRSFLQQAPAGLALAAAAPALARGASPADRLGIGLIGVGSRMSAHLDELLAMASAHNLHIPAVCDVHRPAREAAAARIARAAGQAPQAVARFGDLLALDAVDAVIIATPDFSHGTILNAALDAGKDVYIEKPMTIDLDSATRALDRAREQGRVVQAGTQRRSDGRFQGAAKIIATGALGRVSRVSASIGFNHPRWKRAQLDALETDVDWPAYLLHLPERPFDPSLIQEWQLHRETSNGMPGLWMTHYADAVAMLTGASYPRSAVASGGIYAWNDGREHADTFHAILEYPEGFQFDWGMGLGNESGTHFTVHGTAATLDAERWSLRAESKGAAAQPLPTEPGGSHLENWLDCLRTRQRPVADIALGHQHVVATVMAALAFQTGRRQVYDPQTRTIAEA